MERYEGFEQWLPTTEHPPVETSLSSAVSSQWFTALYDSPVLFSGLLDRDGVVVEANHLSIEGCGLDRAATLHRPFWEGGWWSPDEELAARIRRWCHKTVATAQSLSAVSRYYRGDGSLGMVELGLVPIIDVRAAGGPVTHIAATGLDITQLLTQQAAREDRLAAETDASRRAQQRFRDALDAMIDSVVIAHSIRDTDNAILDFEIDFVNGARIGIAGQTAADLLGHRMCDLYPSWKDSGLFDRFAAVVETGVSSVADRMPYHDVLPDGTVISGFWDLQVAKLDDGFIAASRDVTELVRVEAAARDADAVAAREQIAMDILQRAALSVDLPELDRVDVGLHYQPAVTDVPIGGDWYDVLALPDGHLMLIIADVAGHGPDIASFMVQLRNILRAVATEERDPAELLRRANNVVIALNTLDAPFTTCCAATLDPLRGALRWSLAGHPPALLRSADGNARFLTSTPGLPLGFRTDAQYATSTTAIAPGDRLVLYTDGLIETRHATLDAGMERLRDAVEASIQMGADEAAQWLATTVSSLTDDVALIVLDIAADQTGAVTRSGR